VRSLRFATSNEFQAGKFCSDPNDRPLLFDQARRKHCCDRGGSSKHNLRWRARQTREGAREGLATDGAAITISSGVPA
jgi:hypothetical protein